MNWIDKLERRYGNLGIPYLINWQPSMIRLERF